MLFNNSACEGWRIMTLHWPIGSLPLIGRMYQCSKQMMGKCSRVFSAVSPPLPPPTKYGPSTSNDQWNYCRHAIMWCITNENRGVSSVYSRNVHLPCLALGREGKGRGGEEGGGKRNDNAIWVTEEREFSQQGQRPGLPNSTTRLLCVTLLRTQFHYIFVYIRTIKPSLSSEIRIPASRKVGRSEHTLTKEDTTGFNLQQTQSQKIPYRHRMVF